MPVFIIEDALHGEQCGKFASYEAALQELKARAELPWDVEPNLPPCMNWKDCCRHYEIIEFDHSTTAPWKQIAKTPIFTISAQGVVWDMLYVAL